jgi:hypothetical protein
MREKTNDRIDSFVCFAGCNSRDVAATQTKDMQIYSIFVTAKTSLFQQVKFTVSA